MRSAMVGPKLDGALRAMGATAPAIAGPPIVSSGQRVKLLLSQRSFGGIDCSCGQERRNGWTTGRAEPPLNDARRRKREAPSRRSHPAVRAAAPPRGLPAVRVGHCLRLASSHWRPGFTDALSPVMQCVLHPQHLRLTPICFPPLPSFIRCLRLHTGKPPRCS